MEGTKTFRISTEGREQDLWWRGKEEGIRNAKNGKNEELSVRVFTGCTSVQMAALASNQT